MDEAQQLLLWRWSTIVQLSSVAMAAAFFALLARTNRRPELKWWARAWAFNLLAILVTSLFWALQSAAWLPIVSLLYVGGKSAFTLLLMQGAWAMIRPGGRLFPTRALTIGVVVYAVAVAAVLRDVAVGRYRAAFVAWRGVLGVCDRAVAIAHLWIDVADRRLRAARNHCAGGGGGVHPATGRAVGRRRWRTGPRLPARSSRRARRSIPGRNG